mgnify:CR=1 FL=1
MADPTRDFIDMFRSMLSPAALPFASAVFPSDPKEVERKIAELTAVKTWLTASVATVELSIKALELQHSMMMPRAEPEPDSPAKEGSGLPNPALWAWEVMQKAASGVTAAADKPRAARRTVRKKKAA